MTGYDTALRLAQILVDKKAENLKILDLASLSAFTDFFVIASGTSERHVRTLADSILEDPTINTSRSHHQGKRMHIEGLLEGRWILIDVGGVVVHLFLDAIREYYNLESLWSQATRVPLPQKLFAPSASELRYS